ncbi:MAG: hypothetical protein EOO10_06795 [Chitinophagaceae bacterium]|nr:MAG: hypothetical protein EOO10_06795 [Chitinophagaceae bacterium]
MKKQLCCIVLAIMVSLVSTAQEYKKASAPTAVYAYAKGNDSYVFYANDTYDAKKKYTVLKIWQEGQPLTEQEKTDLDILRKHLAKKNAEVREIKWKSEEDLQAALNSYNIEASSKDGKHINLKGEKFTLNTTSGKALLVLEDDKPLSICSGQNYEERMKVFFKFKARI